MKITVKQNELSKALNLVSRIAGGARATLPILNNVLIKAEDKKVTLTTTNLDMAVVDYLPVSDSEEGTITVPAKLMAEFISNLPSGESITLSTEGEKVICKAGKYTSRVNGAEAEDFPELPEIDEEKAVIFTISADEFKKGMSQVTVAASNDTTRPALRGVYFNTYEGALYLAATDGYRMAELKFIEKVESEVKAIVPVESLQEVLRSISEEQEEVVMLFDETQVRFRLGEVEITSKLIDGTFPNYRELMPESNEVEMILDRAEVMRITKLAALFARAANGVIVAEANKETQKFSIAAVANEFGENNSEIECEIPENAKASMSARYVIDALNALEEEKVKLGLSTNKAKPILIENEKSKNYRHIIMPLNV